MARVLRPALLLLCAVASAGAGAGESLRVHSPVRSSCRPLRTVVLPGAVELGEAGRSWETLRLRGGSGNNNFQRYMDNVGLSDPNEFFRDFGDGPGNVDCSSTMFEIKPDSFNDTDSLMDGAGLWDFPGELRLVGEHIAPRVGHRVYPSTYLKDFWRKFNFTDYRDGWDHQSDRLGSVVGITDDGRTCEVQWDRLAGNEGSCDWYATGYLANYFLSLAPDELQPLFGPPKEKLEAIARLEKELADLKEQVVADTT